MAEDVCCPVAHRQAVRTIPKRLRLHTRFDRTLLGKLCTCVWTCLQAEVRHLLGRDETRRRIEDLRVLVDKTGGPREQEAFALLAAAAAG